MWAHTPLRGHASSYGLTQVFTPACTCDHLHVHLPVCPESYLLTHVCSSVCLLLAAGTLALCACVAVCAHVCPSSL